METKIKITFNSEPISNIQLLKLIKQQKLFFININFKNNECSLILNHNCTITVNDNSLIIISNLYSININLIVIKEINLINN